MTVTLLFIFLQIHSAYPKIDNKNKSEKDIKIEAIANLYGYARYFYPNQYADKINWYKFLMHTLRESKKIENDTEKIAEFLYRSFSPLMPEMQLSTSNKTFGIQRQDKVKSTKSFYITEHYGIGGRNVFGTKMPFHSKVVKKNLSDELPVPNSLYSYPICAEITLRYPIAISKLKPSLKRSSQNIIQTTDSIDLRTTSSLIKSLRDKTDVFKPIKNQDESLRIADVIIHWNVLRFFYPYLKEDGLSDERMIELLLSYTKKAALAKNLEEYYFYVLREFMGFFNDQHIVLISDFSGQGLVSGYINTENNFIGLEYIDGNIVSQYNIQTQNNEKIKRGDALIAVNDIPINLFLKEQLKYISAATYTTRIEQLLRHGFETLDTESAFKYTFKNQKGDTLSYLRGTNDKAYNGFSSDIQPKNDDFIQNLGNGVFYVLLSSKMCSVKSFEKFLTDTPDIQKVIFELRKYPNPQAFELLGFLSEKSVIWGDYRLPLRYFPEQNKTIWKEEIEKISPKLPTVKAPAYFIINSKTTSYAESMANAIKKNNLGTLVGTNTSGTNGTMGNASVRLFPFMLTIGKDFDGYHGKGISPDIEIKQSIEDYVKGTDSVIEYILNL